VANLQLVNLFQLNLAKRSEERNMWFWNEKIFPWTFEVHLNFWYSIVHISERRPKKTYALLWKSS